MLSLSLDSLASFQIFIYNSYDIPKINFPQKGNHWVKIYEHFKIKRPI